MSYKGDFAEDALVETYFTTNSKVGGRLGFSNALEVADFEVYKDGATTGSTAGLTVTNDFDSKVGLHRVQVDMSADSFYEPGKEYALVLYPDETVDGESVVSVVMTWSVLRRYYPTVAPKRGVALGNLFFKMVSSSDHVSGVAGATVTVTKCHDNEVAFTSTTGTVTEIASGVYAFDASATDMDADSIVFRFTASGADPVELAIATTP